MSASRVIGVDLGGTKILAGLVERDGSVARHVEFPTPTESQDALLAGLDEAVGTLLDGSVAALGFGLPSTIDQRTGRAVTSVNIPLADLDFRDRMRERFGLPVGIDNDGNAATIAEWQAGAGRGTTDLVMLTLGTGCGGGLVLAGRPYRGFMGAGAELGHIVIEYDGKPCQGVCTGRGHLEAYVTGLAASEAAREAFGPAADAHRLVRLANEGDETAREILTGIGRRLGAGIGTLVNVFNPELVLVGGGFGVAAGEHLLAPARETMMREGLAPQRDLVRVERASLGTTAGLIGAGFVAFEALDSLAPTPA